MAEYTDYAIIGWLLLRTYHFIHSRGSKSMVFDQFGLPEEELVFWLCTTDHLTPYCLPNSHRLHICNRGQICTNLMFVPLDHQEEAVLKTAADRPWVGSVIMYHAVRFCPNEHQSNEPYPKEFLAIPHRKPSPSVEIFCLVVEKIEFVYFFFWLASCSFITFLTIFCSSIRKARTIRSRTQPPHREPP